jgi:hypothetical protein
MSGGFAEDTTLNFTSGKRRQVTDQHSIFAKEENPNGTSISDDREQLPGD